MSLTLLLLRKGRLCLVSSRAQFQIPKPSKRSLRPLLQLFPQRRKLLPPNLIQMAPLQLQLSLMTRKICLLKGIMSISGHMVESLCTFPLSKLLLTCSGEWERRLLKFGIKDGYSAAALATYIATHKLNALSSVSTEKVNGYWDNAAHASVTGVGLLLIFRTSNLDIPLNIINLV